jgi:hypothetical protein
MYDHVSWPHQFDPKTSAIYALNDIDVNAPPEVVWKLLVDAKNWSSYFPAENQVKILSGEPELWQAMPSFRGSSGSVKVQLVNVIGDPSKPGLYIQLEKVAPRVVIQAHHHGGDRTVAVLQGTLMFGNGPKFDRRKLNVLHVASTYTEASGSPHFAATGDQSAVTEVTGYGPTDIVYEKPVDDPAKKK